MIQTETERLLEHDGGTQFNSIESTDVEIKEGGKSVNIICNWNTSKTVKSLFWRENKINSPESFHFQVRRGVFLLLSLEDRIKPKKRN